MRNEIDIQTIAPIIIDDVARELMSDRLIFHEIDSEIRFGNRGSFCVNKHKGTFSDFETDTHGGLLDMIVHLCNFERRPQAMNWLKEKGFLDGSFTRRESNRSMVRRTTSTNGRDLFKYGEKLWDEAVAIPFAQRHPVRRWCNHRNLFPGYRELPPALRWHEQKQYIIVALASVQGLIETYPEPPQPRQFHLISIDSGGRKGNAFRGEDKRTYGQPGVTCVALFGDPNAAEINICEGIADALAIFSRCPGTVIASITTFHKLTRCEPLMQHLTADGRTVTLFGDNDTAGEAAQEKLARTLYNRGGDIFYHPNPTAKDPAEAAQMEVKNE